jgi:FtsH-binding integral membrane protein
MKKTLTTIALAGFITLLTATFSFAEYAATGGENFPYFHLGALIIGGLSIISLRKKYKKIYMSEAMGAFALYTVMVALTTSPVVDVVKAIVG